MLLYAIFINDLVPRITAGRDVDCCMFADDVNAWSLAYDEDGGESLQRSLDRISIWADTWRVRFGAKKCNVVLFGRGAVHPAVSARLAKLSLTRFIVERVKCYNFLGVQLDEQLLWHDQAKSVMQRAHYAAYNIARLIRPLSAPGP